MIRLTRRARTIWSAAAIVAVAACGIGIYSSTGQEVAPADAEVVGSVLPRDQLVVVGGVTRPLTDVARHDTPFRRQRADAENNRPERGFHSYGRTPRLAPDANATVASAYEGLITGDHPERLSVLLPPAKFDPPSYARDPAAYLEKFVPGRVWQTAQPGFGTPVLTPLVAPRHLLVQGESVRLKVKAAPRAPVTFTSLDLGAFQNRLPSITVAADEAGEAEATFTATPGTIFRVNILAASPKASGQAQFQVWISPPDVE